MNMYDKEACQTLNALIGCDERKGKEGSICPKCGTSHTITEELLKQEAYKWLRELKRNPIEFQCEDEAPRTCDNLKRWIEYFFNMERNE